MLALQAGKSDAELLAFERFAGRDKHVAALPALQRALLLAAFCALRPGGVLLYVTCSSEPAQGEAVVEWLLAARADAHLERVETHGVDALRVGAEGRMARFTPVQSCTSGLFVSRIARRLPAQDHAQDA
eukprot:2877064-Prymnesium_polylepis.1